MTRGNLLKESFFIVYCRSDTTCFPGEKKFLIDLRKAKKVPCGINSREYTTFSVKWYFPSSLKLLASNLFFRCSKIGYLSWTHDFNYHGRVVSTAQRGWHVSWVGARIIVRDNKKFLVSRAQRLNGK